MRQVGRVFAIISGICVATVAARAAHAVSPFGVATPDPGGGAFGGPLAPFFAWVALHQQHFYRALTGALGSLRQDPHGVWLLLGLSFAYGVFHAVGPGHGKTVITSYLLASGETARRGVLLSFAAALVQAASAIAVVAVGAIVLGVSAVAMTFATDWIEIASYGAIAAVGAWMLWAKTLGVGHHHYHHHHHDHDHDHHSHPEAPHRSSHDHPPTSLTHSLSLGASLARAWSAILAVGIRPCSGAIIVLVFALSQGIFAVGVAAALVMAVGTGLTVATLAVLAVSARGVAVRLTGTESAVAYRLVRGLEIVGAAAILFLGVTLLGGVLSAGLPG